MIEGLSISFVTMVVTVLGAPGMVILMWYVDQRRLDRMREEHAREQTDLLKELRDDREEHQKEMNKVLDAYRNDIREARRMYEDNVLLVKNYERLSADHMDTIRLNTQTQTALLTLLKERKPCHEMMKGSAA